MNRKMKAVLLIKWGFLFVCLIALLTLFSCATEISTRASRVYMVSALQVPKIEAQCEFLGNVTGSSFLWGGCCLSFFSWRGVTYSNALNELLDNAAELGATHIFVNLGTEEGLRGNAYRCAYCQGPDGNPDTAYCQGPDGNPDTAYCQGPDGKQVGAAHCEGSEGNDQAECEENCGKWIPAIDQTECKKKGYRWIPEADNPIDCGTRGGKWIPIANDQITCESKGGTWILDRDVIVPIPLEEQIKR